MAWAQIFFLLLHQQDWTMHNSRINAAWYNLDKLRSQSCFSLSLNSSSHARAVRFILFCMPCAARRDSSCSIEFPQSAFHSRIRSGAWIAYGKSTHKSLISIELSLINMWCLPPHSSFLVCTFSNKRPICQRDELVVRSYSWSNCIECRTFGWRNHKFFHRKRIRY